MCIRDRHRTNPVAMGHVMWACVTAMGALDRVAAAFGALHLDATPDARVHDFAQLYEHRREIKNCDPVRTWLRDVKADACLLYTSDAADDLTRVDLGGRRIIKK